VPRATQPREQRAPDRQAAQVRAEHHGKGVRAGAEELHEHFRPHHLVAERHATGNRVEHQRRHRTVGPSAVDVLRSTGHVLPTTGAGRTSRRRHGLAPPVDRHGRRGHQQARERRDEPRTADAERRHEQEGRDHRAGNRAGGVCGVQAPGGWRHGGLAGAQRAQEGRQRAAHQERRHTDQQERQGPRERAGRLAERNEERGRTSQQEGGDNTGHRHARLEPGVQPHGTVRPVREPPEDQRASGEAGKERRQRDRHRMHFHADDAPELLHPERLEDERGEARPQEQDGHRRTASGQSRRGGSRGNGTSRSGARLRQNGPPKVPALAGAARSGARRESCSSTRRRGAAAGIRCCPW
jgi:hypothetical protein